MPQLVKGGKHVFAWSIVGKNGEIPLPVETREEYGLKPKDKVILISGSKTSGGFSIIKYNVLKQSKLSVIFDDLPQLKTFSTEKGTIISYNNRKVCWTTITDKKSIVLPLKTLHIFGVKPNDRLLSVRGSGLGVGFIVKGPIIAVAKKHAELQVCTS